jgi:hypothetical protein
MEFSLKENNFISRGPRSSVQPDWNRFVKKFEDDYELSEAAMQLLAVPPQVQIVTKRDQVHWRDLQFEEGLTDLAKVVLVVKTIRNNLFHGGKHGIDYWDNPDRMRLLPTNGKLVLDSFAKLAYVEADYSRYY